MSIKDIKAEARRKLALNMHQAIVVYTIEFAIFITLLALVSIAAVCIEIASGAPVVAAAVMIVYGVALMLIAITCSGLVNYAMIDHYLTSYKCKPYNVRRIGEVIARNGIVKIFKLNVVRTLLGFLLSLLLIVPGVIYLVRTSMANHLMIANPKMTTSTALSASNKVMGGKTGAYFGLIMSFIGWYALGIVTLGIGFIFIMPYVNLSKTVYYKRNLQGDKTVYNIAAQPVSPIASAPGEMPPQYVPQTEPISAVRAAEPVAESVNPIETLGAEDMAEMNAAMRDFGAEVQEVPLTPVVTNMRKSSTASAEVTVEPIAAEPIAAEAVTVEPQSSTDAAQPAQPAQSDRPAADADSDIVEIVKPLTTQELKDSDEIVKRRIAALYSGVSPEKPPKRDYISHVGSSGDKDGFVDSFDDPEPTAVEPAATEPAAPQSAASASSRDEEIVMTDEQFDAFMREFDAPKQDPSFTPLRRTPQKPEPTREPQKPEPKAHVEPTREPQKPASGGSVVRTPPVNPAPSGESRAEMLRREREERIQKLRNSRK